MQADKKQATSGQTDPMLAALQRQSRHKTAEGLAADRSQAKAGNKSRAALRGGSINPDQEVSFLLKLPRWLRTAIAVEADYTHMSMRDVILQTLIESGKFDKKEVTIRLTHEAAKKRKAEGAKAKPKSVEPKTETKK